MTAAKQTTGRSRNLTLFLDGTWNTPESHTNVWTLFQQSKGPSVTPEEVRKYHRHKKAKGIDLTKQAKYLEAEQLRFYDTGVGTKGIAFVGGIAGYGLSKNIMLAYQFLCQHYRAKPSQINESGEQPDNIYLFGFSRGAYTARSLVGMINAVGLLPPEHSTNANVKAALDAYKLFRDDKTLRAKLRQDFIDKWKCHTGIRIKFIGVWDTVGSLGIPIKLPFFPDYHKFHDTALSSSVDYAYHAVAIDEHRKIFDATLWDINNESSGNKIVEQCWFVGAHANVGGGQRDNYLSNIPLQWMMKKAQYHGLQLQPNFIQRPMLNHEPITDSYRQFVGGLYHCLWHKKPHLREVKLTQATTKNKIFINKLHPSVESYQQANPNYLPQNRFTP